MNILFDSQAFDLQTHGGISRCFAQLYKRMPSSINCKIGVKETNNVYLQSLGFKKKGELYRNFLIKGLFPGKGQIFELIYNKILNYDYWFNYNRNYCIKLLTDGKYDVFHPTFYNDYFLKYLNKKKPFVLTIHDMIHELYPQYYSSNDIHILAKRKLASQANAIIAVSNNTKEDIIRILKVPEKKIHVIYHGKTFPDHLIYNECPFPFKYILYIGDRTNYKNFISFVKHSSPFFIKHPDIKIICSGKTFSIEEITLLKNLHVYDQYIQLFVKDDIELANLYHHAICFVYPSEYEGFGIPILEAYQTDCIAMLNKKSCFPEIAENAAIFFIIQKDFSNIIEKLEYVIHLSPEKKQQHLLLQKKQLEKYSWDKSVNELITVYKQIV